MKSKLCKFLNAHPKKNDQCTLVLKKYNYLRNLVLNFIFTWEVLNINLQERKYIESKIWKCYYFNQVMISNQFKLEHAQIEIPNLNFCHFIIVVVKNTKII